VDHPVKHLVLSLIHWSQQHRLFDTFLWYDIFVGTGRTFLSGVGIGIGVSATFAASSLMISLQERATFPMIMAEIESYRALPESVKCSPQISNTIANLNARVAHEKESNRHGFSDLFSTDRWNNVQPITVTCASQDP